MSMFERWVLSRNPYVTTPIDRANLDLFVCREKYVSVIYNIPPEKKKATNLIFLLASFGVFVQNLLQIHAIRTRLGNSSSLILPLRYVRELRTLYVHK